MKNKIKKVSVLLSGVILFTMFSTQMYASNDTISEKSANKASYDIIEMIKDKNIPKSELTSDDYNNLLESLNKKSKEEKALEKDINKKDENHKVIRSAFTKKDVDKGFVDFSAKKADYKNISKALKNEKEKNKATGRVVGLVYDQHSGESIQNASIVFEELGVTTETDSEGRFELNNIPEGEYNIIVEAEGYLSANYNNMPLQSAAGVEIYSLPISSYISVEEDFLQDIKKDNHSYSLEDVHQSEIYSTPEVDGINMNVTSTETLMTSETQPNFTASLSSTPDLQTYTVKYGNSILSFGSNINEYLYYCVSNEMTRYTALNTSQLLTAYKCQAISARTYADYCARWINKHEAEGYTLCSNECCQMYIPYRTNLTAIQAVDDTTNQIIFDVTNNRRVMSEYFDQCNGYTTFNGKTMTCTQHFTPDYGGHGRGMCQSGAAYKATEGWSYSSILSFYYPGTTLITAIPPVADGINAGETKRIDNSYSKEYLLYVPSSATYTIETSKASSSTYDTVIAVYNTNGVQVAYNDDINYPSNLYSRVNSTLAKGLYRIEVKEINNDAFSSMLTVTYNPANVSAKTYTTNDPYNYVQGEIQKVFKFVPSTTKTYTIETSQHMTSQDTYLKLLNSNGTQLTYNDDTNGLYAVITYQLTANTTYYIVVTSYNYGGSPTPYIFDLQLYTFRLPKTRQ